jgi:hypothetical protein
VSLLQHIPGGPDWRKMEADGCRREDGEVDAGGCRSQLS